IAGRALLEEREHAGLVVLYPLGEELSSEHGLARAGGACDESGVSARDAAAKHRVEAADAGGEARALRHARCSEVILGGLVFRLGQARVYRYPGAGDAEGMEPREIAASAHLHDAHLPHDGVPLDLLAENDDAIGDRVDWVVLDLRLRMLADQERRGFPGGEVNGQSVDEVLKRQLSTVRIARRPADR